MVSLNSRSGKDKLRKSVVVRGSIAIAVIVGGISQIAFVPSSYAKVQNQPSRSSSRVARFASFSPPDVSTMKAMLDDPEIIKQAETMGVKDLDAVKALMDDPDKFGELQKAVGAMMHDVMASENAKRTLDDVLQKLEGDPELEEFFKAVKEDGPGAFMKYANDEMVQSKLRAAHVLVREELIQKRVERNSNEEWIKKIFNKFDKDQDGILSLDEFNELQVAAEGPDATYTQEQLEQLLQDVNADVKDASKGMFFAEFRKMYVDADTSMRYTTDLVADHEKIFGEVTMPA